MESLRQPVVRFTSFTYDVQIGSDGVLTPNEIQRLEGWFNSIGLAYGDRVSIMSGAAYSDETARQGIDNVVARHGILIEKEEAIEAGVASDGVMRVVVRRAFADVPGCPDWSDTQENNGIGTTSRNFGCGVNGNLAAMVADPEDLVRGKTSTSDLRIATSNKAIKAYREKAPAGASAGGN